MDNGEQGQGRRYKSRSQPPCDACRKRRIGCIRLSGVINCSLCQARQVNCTYNSIPKPKHGRSPSKRYATSSATPEDQGKSDDERVAPESTDRTSTALEESTRWVTQFIGLSGDQDPFVLRHCIFDTNCYRQTDWACLRVNENGEAPTHFTAVPDSHLDARPPYYPDLDVHATITANNNQMLLAYLNVVHPSFPLLDSLSPSQQDQRNPVLLAAMCAMAAPFATGSTEKLYKTLSYFTAQAIQIERRHPRIELVEAAIVFVQRHAIIHRAPTTPGLWAEIGSVVGMCHELGLNVDPSSWNITREHRNRRIRLWWAVYIFDKFCSFDLGRPSYIHEENATVPMLSLQNFDQNNPSVPICSYHQFVALAFLSVILSKLLSTFYSLKAVDQLRQTAAEDIYSLFESYQKQLLAFKAEHIDTLPAVDEGLDSKGTVILAFHAVEIALCRAVLRNLFPSYPMYCSAVRLYAKSAVESVVNLLAGLQENQVRAYWWHPLSNIHFSLAGSFMFFLLLTSTNDGDVEYWHTQIKNYKQLLQLQSLRFGVTRLAATRISLLSPFNEEAFMQSPSETPDTSSPASTRGHFHGDLMIELGDGMLSGSRISVELSY